MSIKKLHVIKFVVVIMLMLPLTIQTFRHIQLMCNFTCASIYAADTFRMVFVRGFILPE